MDSKVERVTRKHGLAEIENRLVDFWTQDGDEHMSLRELADYFNQELLRETMKKAEMTTFDGEVANTYRLLTDNDVSVGVRTQVETSLKHNGIDLDQVQKDFVSHQAIYTYLTKYRDVEYQESSSQQDRIADAKSTVQQLRSRIIAVTEQRLRSLRDANIITIGTFSVLVDIRVICEDCDTHIDIPTLLRERGCDCSLNN